MRNEQLAMSNEKRTMKSGKYSVLFVAALVCVMLLDACVDNYEQSMIQTKAENQTQVKDGYGRIKINLVDGESAHQNAERTVFPSTVFDSYAYIFTKTDGGSAFSTPDKDGYFTLEIGSYKVTVSAYKDGKPAATGESAEFTIAQGENGEVQVSLTEINSSEQGFFTYTITYPADAEAEITLKKWPDLEVDLLNPELLEDMNGKPVTLPLDPGSYLFTVLVKKDSRYMGISEAVQIYPAVTTEYGKEFIDSDFLVPTFDSIEAFANWLDGQQENDATTPYIVKLNVGALGGNKTKSVFEALLDNDTKYVNLDLSGSTFTSIEENAFRNLHNLTSITIPDRVTSIGEHAFEYCTNLTSIIIPDSVTSIGIDAFYETAWLDNQLDGLVYAGKVAYAYKGTMPENTNITFHDGTKGITGYAFFKCKNLTSVNITNSVTSIGDFAFAACTDLTSVTIGNGLINIGERAFSGCTSLTAITVATGNTAYSLHDGVLYNKNITTLVVYPAGKTGSTFIIPDSVKDIGDSAFHDCTSLTSVTIPSGVTSIGEYAFENCTSLTSVTFAIGSNIADAYFGSDAFPTAGNGNGSDYLKDAYYSMGKAGTYIREIDNVWWTIINGDGSSTDPFRVYDEETLQRIGRKTSNKWYGDWDLDKHYKQTTDITLTSVAPGESNWTPIGADEYDFQGVYDGGNHTISNITISTSSSYQGLFGYINNDAIVKNVRIVNCNIIGGSMVGGVVGFNQLSTVQNCYVEGTVSGTGAVGGVVGKINYGTVQDCCYSTSTGAVSGADDNGSVGGVVGYNNGGTVKNCYSTGAVSGGYSVGGVVGYNSGTVQNCYATGNVEGLSLYIGGVVGLLEGDSVIVQNCVALNLYISYGEFNERFAGNNHAGLTNNFGRSDMTNGNNDPWSSDADGVDGENITWEQWGSETWWTGTAFFDADVWDFSGINATKLPKLRNIPAGVQNPVVQPLP
ncbi:hypothetical protein R84B8_02908 [Treponema sp. R8-4-B8]